MARIYKSDLCNWGSNTLILLFWERVLQTEGENFYRRKTTKLSYRRSAAYRQIMSESMSNIFQGYFIALSCHKSRQLQKQINTFQTDVFCYSNVLGSHDQVLVAGEVATGVTQWKKKKDLVSLINLKKVITVFRTVDGLVKDGGHQTLTATMTWKTEAEEGHCKK